MVVESVRFFFFQAEDGIRDGHVTGVQTCALPISSKRAVSHRTASEDAFARARKGLVEEGISTSRMYRSGSCGVEDLGDEKTARGRSCFTYEGAGRTEGFRCRGDSGQQCAAG